MTVVLGLVAALAYGLSDFAGGLAARFRGAVTILVYAYPVGAVIALGALVFLPGALSPTTLAFGAAGGVAGLIGVVSMYSAVTLAPMNVVSPVTAVLAAVVPVVAGLTLGERPALTAWLGIAMGLAAVVAVSRGAGPVGHVPARAVLLSLLAGLGFGFYFVFLARADSDSGVWPLLVSRLVSAVLILPLAVRQRALQPIGGRVLALAVGAGALDALANLAFLLASRAGLLSVAGVLTSLYPAITVLLAAALLHERTTLVQRFGLAGAAAAIVLITV